MSVENADFEHIAIIGLAGRFPGADTPEELWHLVSLAQSGIRWYTREELTAEGLECQLVERPEYVRARGALGAAELFDAEFFGYSPREAEHMDPQQRVFLELAWHALEDASCNPSEFDGRVGVFAGSNLNSYLIYNHLPNLKGRPSLLTDLQALIASDKDFLTTRVSYKLGLTGPSMAIQTACSTSLVAVHLAVQTLLAGETDLALAGGVSVGSPRKQGYLYEAGGILSPDGRCLPFDARSAGTVPAEGAGIVVLKRLQDALADGDAVRAVILGSAVNNDGTNKAGFTAPSVTGQARVIREALGVAAVSARSIGYVETHGTGTALGDPLEFEALCQAFRVETSEQGFCALGALKANVGHLDTAAGVAGLIKAVLALQRGQLPPLRGFQTPNPRIDLDSSPFYVPTQLTPWPRGQTPRRAGVSAFGIGGTNVHVVLQEAPAVPAPLERSDAPAILALSARSSQELHALRMQWAQTAQRSDVTLQSLARATQTGRKPMRQRRAWVVESLAELQHVLSSDAQDGFVVEDRAPSVAFVFPGQGSAYPGMGRELWDVEPVYRKALQTCFEQAPPIASRRLADWFQQGGAGFERTDVGQPLLFAVEYALAQLWLSRGLEPVAMVGHSLGEYVAACLADVLSLQDALKLIEARGRLAQQTASGAMLAVAATDTSVRELLDASLSIAAYNTPNRVVVSGSAAQIEAFEQHAQERAWLVQRLNTSHAFHSAQVEPMLQTFRDVVSEVQLRAPQRRYVSNVSGNWAGIEVTQPQYWVEQLRQPVQFSRAVSHVGQQLAPTVWVELGPGPTLGPLVRGNLRSAVTVSTLSAGRERRATAAAHAALWTQGVNLRWPKLHHPLPSAPLPRYPFRRITHWIRPRSHECARSPLPENALRTNSLARDVETAPPPQPSTLREIWSEVLGAPPHSTEANFFEQGGDSLLAIALGARIRSLLGVPFDLAAFLEHPTLQHGEAILSGKVETSPVSRRPTTITPLRRIARGARLPSLSIIFFSGEATDATRQYASLQHIAQWADREGFEAIWIPERHFSNFGGLYPNPAVLAAALASATKRIRIRAGSVVLPLHDPIRVAEEWAVVDNVSGGRVDLAFAPGFNPRDYALAPELFADRRARLYDSLEQVLALWNRQTVTRSSGNGKPLELQSYPAPAHAPLSTWIAAAESEASFQDIGRRGHNVLTALLSLTVPQLESRIQTYRTARARSGSPAEAGRVTLMIHTFVDDTKELAWERLHAPFRAYLGEFGQFLRSMSPEVDKLRSLEFATQADADAIYGHAFRRYFETASLMGDEESVSAMLQRLASSGVDEIACLVDFGLSTEEILKSLKRVKLITSRLSRNGELATLQ